MTAPDSLDPQVLDTLVLADMISGDEQDGASSLSIIHWRNTFGLTGYTVCVTDSEDGVATESYVALLPSQMERLSEWHNRERRHDDAAGN